MDNKIKKKFLLGGGVKDFLLVNRTTGQTAAKNTFWLTISNVGGRALRAVVIIYSARVLGATEWGLFSYALSFVALITVFTDFGIGPILTREAAKTSDPLQKSRIVSTAFFLKIALLVVGVGLVIFAAPDLTTIKEARFLFPIVSLILIFDTLQGFGFSLVRSLEKMELEAAFYLTTNVAIVIFGFLALHFSPSVRFFAYAYAAGTAVGATVTIFALRKYFSKIFSNFQKKLVAPILGSAWPFVISGLMGSLMLNTDILLIGFFLSAEQVGIYSAADRPIQLLYVLPAILATSIFPIFARLAVSSQQKMRSVLERVLSLAFLLSMPLALGGLVLGGDIIRIVFGQAYIPAVSSFRVLVITISINFTTAILSNAIFAYNRQKDLIKFAALGGIINIVLDLIFIPRFGILGSAWATFCAQLIGNFYLWNKMRQLNSFSILPKIKKVGAAALIMALAVFGLHRLGVNLFLNIAIGAAIYFAFLYFMKERLLRDIKFILRPGASSELESSELASL